MLSFFLHFLVLILVAGTMLYQRKKLLPSLITIAVLFAVTSYIVGPSYFF